MDEAKEWKNIADTGTNVTRPSPPEKVLEMLDVQFVYYLFTYWYFMYVWDLSKSGAKLFLKWRGV